MRILAIDTSARASVAYLDITENQRRLLASDESKDATSHAEWVSLEVAKAIEEHGVPDRIAVGAGPGPFTGLRVGYASAQALAFAFSIPLDTIGSLEALCAQGAEQYPEAHKILAVTDARRREVYWSLSGVEGGETRLLEQPQVCQATHLPVLESLRGEPGVVVVGEGALTYSEAFHAMDLKTTPSRPQAQWIAELSARAWMEGKTLPVLMPQYLRESDAKIPAQATRNLPPQAKA